MVPITQHSLQKLETLLQALGFKIRYEKGSFRTGACILQDSKVVVVNRFLNLEARIHAITGLLLDLPFDGVEEELLDAKQKQLLRSIKQTKLKI